jgi:peptide/nickel transport system substrate-binding protein
VLWDLSKPGKATDIKPGLATDWQVDEANPKRWIFKLREASSGMTGAASRLMT